MPTNRVVYTVSDVNKYIKAVINNDQNLRYISVKGEISNLKYGANGHVYFSLKDKESIISVCLFSTYASKLNFKPENGDEVIALASVDVYPARGSYQLIAIALEQAGKGDILYELEQLKKQLASEGLFDEKYKKKDRAEWLDYCRRMKAKYPLSAEKQPVDNEGKVDGFKFADKLSDFSKADADAPAIHFSCFLPLPVVPKIYG